MPLAACTPDVMVSLQLSPPVLRLLATTTTKTKAQETVNSLFALSLSRARGAMHVRNLLNKIKNWQKATSWLFTKRSGVEFRTTKDKTRSQRSERGLIP